MTHAIQNGMNFGLLKNQRGHQHSTDEFNQNSKLSNVICNPVQFASLPHSLPREMVPKLIWEPGILTGYRPMNQPWKFYIRSLFWIHNETGNIWTHLLAPLFTLAMLYTFSKHIDFSTNGSAHGC